ncbi:MAG: hypothetical protein BEN18_07695 [Epulopiscium sp. Nuni2H_MBin001]|nr:MAG: hypothetical protein BEN18_07695 [Epulopiscium sp. Nuni2H_MBin001]
MEFKQSETCLNLMRAYAGECQAYTRYLFYGRIAHKEGFKELEILFNETAANEEAHAKIYFDLLYKNIGTASVPVNAEYPVHISKTADNLKHSAESENEEHTIVYPAFAKKAEEEGFKQPAKHFQMIAEIEAHHEERFNRYLDQLATNTLFSRSEDVYYRCLICGHVHKCAEAPKICPNCFHPQGFFEIIPYPSVL